MFFISCLVLLVSCGSTMLGVGGFVARFATAAVTTDFLREGAACGEVNSMMTGATFVWMGTFGGGCMD